MYSPLNVPFSTLLGSVQNAKEVRLDLSFQGIHSLVGEKKKILTDRSGIL